MQRYCANLHSNASDPQSVGESSDDDAQQKPQCGAPSHNQSDLDNLPDGLETSTE